MNGWEILTLVAGLWFAVAARDQQVLTLALLLAFLYLAYKFIFWPRGVK